MNSAGITKVTDDDDPINEYAMLPPTDIKNADNNDAVNAAIPAELPIPFSIITSRAELYPPKNNANEIENTTTNINVV